VTEVVRISTGVFPHQSHQLHLRRVPAVDRREGRRSGGQRGLPGAVHLRSVGNRLERRVTVGGNTLQTTYAYDANDRLLSESNAVVSARSEGTSSSSPLQGGVTNPPDWQGRAAWSHYFWLAMPGLLLLSFLAPVFLVPWHQWRRGRLLTMDCSRRVPFPRCVAGLLTVVMAIVPVNFQAVARDATAYAVLNTDTWGLNGSVTNYEYNANGSVVRKVTTGPNERTVEYGYNLGNRLESVVSTNTEAPIGRRNGSLHLQHKRNPRAQRIQHNGERSPDFGKHEPVPRGHRQSLRLCAGLEECRGGFQCPRLPMPLGTRRCRRPREDGAQATDYLLPDGHGSNRQLVGAAEAF